MSHIKYLKDKSEYEDSYDRETVRQCLWAENYVPKEKTPLSVDEKRAVKMVLILSLYLTKGNRYKERDATIKQWMEDDRMRDEKVEYTPIPENVTCKFCDKPMKFIDSHLSIDFDRKGRDHMKFYFGCKECQVMKIIYDDGRIEDRIPWKCPKCSRKLTTTEERTADKITTTDICSFCGYKNVHELDLTPEPPEKEPSEQELKEYRINKDRFCLSDKEGFEYIQQEVNMKACADMLERNKENPPPNIKMLTLPQLEKILIEAAEKEGFIRFEFGKPNMTKDVIIEFSIQDTTSRENNDSKKKLKKILSQVTEGTNWSLMASGIDYRLGILTGRIKGLELGRDFFLDKNGDKILL